MEDVDISDFEDEEISGNQDNIYVLDSGILRRSKSVRQSQKSISPLFNGLWKSQGIADGLNKVGNYNGLKKSDGIPSGFNNIDHDKSDENTEKPQILSSTDTVDNGVVVPEKVSVKQRVNLHEKCIIKEQPVDMRTELETKRGYLMRTVNQNPVETEASGVADYQQQSTLRRSMSFCETRQQKTPLGFYSKTAQYFPKESGEMSSQRYSRLAEELKSKQTKPGRLMTSADQLTGQLNTGDISKYSIDARLIPNENNSAIEKPIELPTEPDEERGYSVRPVYNDPVEKEPSALSDFQRQNTLRRSMSFRDKRRPKKSQHIHTAESGEIKSQRYTRPVEELKTEPSKIIALSDQQTEDNEDNIRYPIAARPNAIKNDDKSSDGLKSVKTREMYSPTYSTSVNYSEQQRHHYKIEEEMQDSFRSRKTDNYSPSVKGNKQHKQKSPERIEGYGYSAQTSGYQCITYPSTTAYPVVSMFKTSQPRTKTETKPTLGVDTAPFALIEVKRTNKSKGLQRSKTMRERSGVRAYERTIPGAPRGFGFLHGSMQMNPSTKNTLMQVPEHSIGVWIFGEDNFFTTLPKVWTVSDCIKHVRNKIGNFGYGDLDLWIRNRCIMLNKGKTLSDYPGLKSLYVIRRPRSRDPHPFHQTPRCDDTDPFSDDTCVLMPCGHAISPENLYEYAWSKIQNGGIGVTCPAVPDAKRPSEQCSTIWDFTSVSKLACLSNDENCLFCCQLFSNFVEAQPNIHLCPVCNEAIYSDCATVFKCFNCEKSGTSFSFCVHCHRPIYGRECVNDECQESVPRLKTLLKNCPTRTLVNVPNCPSVRACPKCNCVIEYDEEDSCKHMTCPRNSCQTQFCFICLKVKTDKYYWPCGGAYEPCSPSPRQIM
ncbi:uncharacterized protein [Argopecten irradians]|uniref:uncharacterized protein isoform X1 n=1 Tax=Argopecten irradians TaxID=31199 RepID=UPI00371A6DA6